MLSVLQDEAASSADTAALWAGFFWKACVPEVELFERIKPNLLEQVKRPSPHKSHYSQVLAGILLAAWGSRTQAQGYRLITNSELRSLILEGNPEFRLDTLWILRRWAIDGTKWSDDLPEFLQEVWPKQKSIRTKDISAHLVELVFSQKSNFPEVAKLLPGLVGKFHDDTILIPNLFLPGVVQSEDCVPVKYPDDLLNLFHAILPENSARWPTGAVEALEIVGKTKPSLRTSPKFIELTSRLN